MSSNIQKKVRQVGFIGLGAMGLPMAINVLNAGFSVCGYDIAADAVNALQAAGGKAAARASKAATSADLLVVMVATSDQAEAVLYGPDGAVPSLPPGTTISLCSTVSPVYVKSLENRLRQSQHRLLDAPVSGGTGGAKEATLTVMASGSPAAYQAAEAVLQATASRVFNLGETPGIGSTVKMINQLLVGIYSAASAEAMALGTRAGIDPQVLFDVISTSAGASLIFNKSVPRMIEGNFEPSIALNIFIKDLGIVLETGKSLNFPTPLAAAAHQLFLMGSSAGFGKEDDSALVKVFEKLAGIRVSNK